MLLKLLLLKQHHQQIDFFHLLQIFSIFFEIFSLKFEKIFQMLFNHAWDLNFKRFFLKKNCISLKQQIVVKIYEFFWLKKVVWNNKSYWPRHKLKLVNKNVCLNLNFLISMSVYLSVWSRKCLNTTLLTQL